MDELSMRKASTKSAVERFFQFKFLLVTSNDYGFKKYNGTSNKSAAAECFLHCVCVLLCRILSHVEKLTSNRQLFGQFQNMMQQED
jgi:hypothetical protein